uniref:Cyclin N-terminal domain-containing protein n=1 Tax=Rhabditophanes sp. KR3021 TaxID=114890 RepID=A0AC35TLC1_9BILA
MLRDMTVHAKLLERNHRLTALAILMIACKAEEVHGPLVEDFVKCFVGLTLNQLLNAEVMVLTLINFWVSRPTVYDFTAYLWARTEMTDMMKELEKHQALEFLCNGRLMKVVNILIDAINHALTSNDAISFRLKDKFYQTHGVSPVKFINDNGSKLKRITI